MTELENLQKLKPLTSSQSRLLEVIRNQLRYANNPRQQMKELSK